MKNLDRAFPPTPECVEDDSYEGVRRARRDAVTALFVARDVVGPLLVVHAHVGQVQHVARVGSAARNHFHEA